MIYDLILFDCDGTLVDTEPLHSYACVQLLKEQGIKGYDQNRITEEFMGTKFGDMLKTITSRTGHVFPADMPMQYQNRVRELSMTNFKTVPHVEDIVCRAHERTAIGVASNGQRDNVLLSLDLSKLRQFFPDEHVFTAIQVKNPKPAPDLFLLAAREMKADPARTLVIEDSVVGVTAAAAAGMHVFGFTGVSHEVPETIVQKLKNAGAMRVYGSFIHMAEDLFD